MKASRFHYELFIHGCVWKFIHAFTAKCVSLAHRRVGREEYCCIQRSSFEETNAWISRSVVDLDRRFLIFPMWWIEREAERQMLLMWVLKVRWQSSVTPRSLTSFITQRNWTISNLDRKNWLGRRKMRGEVNDFSLLWVTFKPVKGLSCLTPGSKLVHFTVSKFKMTQILENFFSNLTPWSFKPVSFQSKKLSKL